jgi:hypothetical protein
MIVGMPDDPAKPKQKRWRWIIAGVLLFVGVAAPVWNWQSEARLKHLAAAIQAGQSKEVVRLVLGEPQMTSFRGQAGSYRYGSERGMPWAFRALAFKYLGIGSAPAPNPFPVEVRFGADGRVMNVRILK